MKKIIFYILIIISITPIQAQHTDLDSLETAYLTYLTQDSIRVNLIHEIVTKIYNDDPERAKSLLLESANLSSQLNYKKGNAKALNAKAHLESNQSNYKESIGLFKEALVLYKSIDDKAGASNCLHSLGIDYYSQSDYQEALYYFEESLKLDKEIKDSVGVSYNLNNIGNIYADMGDYENAIHFYTQANEVRIALKDTLGIVKIYNNFGSIYGEQGNLPLALESYKKGLKLYEKKEDELKNTRLFSNISTIYLMQDKLDQALEFMNKDLALKEKNGDKGLTVVPLNIIGQIYFKKGENEKALKAFYETLKINKEVNYKHGIAKSSISLGDVYLDNKDSKTAFKFYNEALIITQEIGNPLENCNAHIGLAKVYQLEKKYSEALSHALEGQKIALDLGLISQQKDAAELLYYSYKQLNNHEKALENHEQFKLLNDSIFNEENIRKITQLEFEYKYQAQLDLANERELTLTKKIDVTNQSLEKSQRNSLFAIIGILLLALVSGGSIFFLKLREQKEKVKAVVNEQKLLRSQMTPHFIFNSLSVLQGIILNKEEGKSVFYLSKFSKLLRTILENSREKTVSLKQELAATEDYIILQNINIDPPCDYAIAVDENIDTSAFNIPPMLIQPFIENVIEHAFGNVKSAKELKIHLSYIDEKLICTIADNGVGIEAHSKKIKSKAKRSLATTITSERLQVLSKDFKFKGSVTVEDRSKYNEQGTLVTLIIPYIKN